MDVALGGEGAPLAPLAHLWLFADPKRGRVVQNIGGIANATYIPPRARLGNPDLIAFDTGPGNGMIDALASRISGGRLRMDRDGRIAASGDVNEPLLAEADAKSLFSVDARLNRPAARSSARFYSIASLPMRAT